MAFACCIMVEGETTSNTKHMLGRINCSRHIYLTYYTNLGTVFFVNYCANVHHDS